MKCSSGKSNGSCWDPLTRDDLLKLRASCLRSGSGIQADVFVLRLGGEFAVYKDVSNRKFFPARYLGAWLIRREFKMCSQLQGLAGIPRPIRMVGREGWLLEFVSGTHAGRFKPGNLPHPEIFLPALRSHIDAIHQLGIAHADLKRRSNIMITEEFQPIILDWATAIRRGNGLSPFRNWLFRTFAQSDIGGVAKLKEIHAPWLLTEEERDLLDQHRGFRLFLRRLRKYRRRCLK